MFWAARPRSHMTEAARVAGWVGCDQGDRHRAPARWPGKVPDRGQLREASRSRITMKSQRCTSSTNPYAGPRRGSAQVVCAAWLVAKLRTTRTVLIAIPTVSMDRFILQALTRRRRVQASTPIRVPQGLAGSATRRGGPAESRPGRRVVLCRGAPRTTSSRRSAGCWAEPISIPTPRHRSPLRTSSIEGFGGSALSTEPWSCWSTTWD